MSEPGKLPVRYCSHPELFPTQWDQPRPAPAQVVYHCRCGQNWSCPVCGWGAGSYPCACMREDMKAKERQGFRNLPADAGAVLGSGSAEVGG